MKGNPVIAAASMAQQTRMDLSLYRLYARMLEAELAQANVKLARVGQVVWNIRETGLYDHDNGDYDLSLIVEDLRNALGEKA